MRPLTSDTLRRMADDDRLIDALAKVNRGGTPRNDSLRRAA